MLRRIDRMLVRVPALPPAVSYYRDAMGLRLLRQEPRVATLLLPDGQTELVLHVDEELPAEAVFFLVDDVRDLYRRRDELRLTFRAPPAPAARGWRAEVRDPFGLVLHLIDRTTADGGGASVEDGKAPGALFAGVDPQVPLDADRLAAVYEKLGRTADDLPYTPDFEALYEQYTAELHEEKPDRAEVWRHVLTLRKRGGLPRVGSARSRAPEPDEAERQRLADLLRELLGPDLGKRDRLPYTDKFDKLVDDFNHGHRPKRSPHYVWRLIASMAK
jgi:catechol 2,3-dioxygenase-like lactoylglutathione lyase family enzyme